jgi:hypothetical protein
MIAKLNDHKGPVTDPSLDGIVGTLRGLGCFGFVATEEGFKCEFDAEVGGRKMRLHLFYDRSEDADLGPFRLYGGGMDIDDVKRLVTDLRKGS